MSPTTTSVNADFAQLNASSKARSTATATGLYVMILLCPGHVSGWQAELPATVLTSVL